MDKGPDRDDFYLHHYLPSPPASPAHRDLPKNKKLLIHNSFCRPPTPPHYRGHRTITPSSHDGAFEALAFNSKRKASIESPATSTPIRPPLRVSKTRSSTGVSATAIFADRFLPARRTPEASLQNFHANKDPKKLSPAERLLRHDQASPDAFNPWHRRATSPIPPITPTRSARRVVSAGRPGSASTISTRIDSHPGPLTERQVSNFHEFFYIQHN